MKRGTKQVTINIRAPQALVEMIDRAAESEFKTRTEFLLGASIERAREVILTHTVPDLPETD
jgi:uncharacterized protein (DUF1778 family)